MLKAQLDKDFIAINAGGISVCNYDGVSREYLSTTTEWEYINDHRGETVYNTETAKPFFITELGDYPTNTTSKVPASKFCKWDGESWVEDVLLKDEADKISAEKYREDILNSIDNTISDWKIELLLGDISDSDKERLSAWMMYKAAVKAVDVSTAPEVIWPQKPE